MPGRTALAALAVALMGAGVAAQSAAPGPPRMPYVAVRDPVFVPASAASFVQDSDFVIGVAKGKIAKAYHALDLQQHGSVDDEMPDGPIEGTRAVRVAPGPSRSRRSMSAARCRVIRSQEVRRTSSSTKGSIRIGPGDVDIPRLHDSKRWMASRALPDNAAGPLVGDADT